MSLNLLLWILVALFVVADILVVHSVTPTTPTTNFWWTVILFFRDVNAKALALVNSIWGDMVKNWHEYAILALIYVLMFGISAPLYFVYVLAGYLIFRLVQDITGVK
jgi:hypothetical protein